MASTRPKAVIAVAYEEAAREYLRGLPMEHFMEAIPQATQRKITLESLDLLSSRRPEVHVFNELLVQYPLAGQRKPGQVVPDNMVVISDEAIEAETSYNLPLEPARPFWVLEYISKNNKRKDYEESFDKYERDLKVPYYLVFTPARNTFPSSRTSTTATLSRSWTWRWAWRVAGFATGMRVPCCRCPAIYSATWIMLSAARTRRNTALTKSHTARTKSHAARTKSHAGPITRLSARRNSNSNCRPNNTHAMPLRPNWHSYVLPWSGKKHAHAMDKNPTSDAADCRL
jgi:Uma2 family endonuclease